MINKEICILVADDFGSMRTQIREILKEMDFRNVAEARDGLEAIDILKTKKIDLVICDWNMPNADGMTVLHHVRGNAERYKDLPFLMVTAIADKKHLIEAVEAKVSNYVVKPFTPQTLEVKIRAVLGCNEPLWKN